LATSNGLWRLSALNAAAEITKLQANNFTAVLEHKRAIVAATFDDGIFIMDKKNPGN